LQECVAGDPDEEKNYVELHVYWYILSLLPLLCDVPFDRTFPAEVISPFLQTNRIFLVCHQAALLVVVFFVSEVSGINEPQQQSYI